MSHALGASSCSEHDDVAGDDVVGRNRDLASVAEDLHLDADLGSIAFGP